jgi:hypothetical protein
MTLVYPQDPRYPPPPTGPQGYPPQYPYAPQPGGYPYAYPQGAPQPPPPSGAPHVFGILSVVFGGLLTLSSLWSLLSAVSTATLGPVFASILPAAAMPPDVMLTWAICTAATAGLMLFMSIALLVSGIGLVKKRAWGHTWSFVWSIASFPVLLVRLVIWHAGVEPATAKAVASIAAPLGAAMQGRHFLGFEDVWCVCLAVYPILLLTMVPRASAVTPTGSAA